MLHVGQVIEFSNMVGRSQKRKCEQQATSHTGRVTAGTPWIHPSPLGPAAPDEELRNTQHNIGSRVRGRGNVTVD